MKSKAKNKKKTEKINFAKELFAVVKFVEPRDDSKSFECIPDNWLLEEEDDEERRRCYWPPKSKKSFILRAMNRDIPDEDWDIYTCEVVSEGHPSYSIGAVIVREKTAQKYNTSSADEHIQKSKFRRQHPGLINKGEKCFENMFAAAKAAQVLEKNQNKVVEEKQPDDASIDTEIIQPGSDKGKQSTEGKSYNPRKNKSENHTQSVEKSSRNESKPHKNRSLSRKTCTSDNHYESHYDRSPYHSNRSRSRSSRSNSRTNRSRSRSNQSESQTIRSLSHNNRSRSRSSRSNSHTNCSRSRSGRSRSRSNQSESQTIRSLSLNNRLRSRSSRSNSHTNRSRSRSNQSESQTIRSLSHNNRSLSRSSRSNSHTNRSRSRSCRSNSHTNRSNARSHHSQSSRNNSESARKNSSCVNNRSCSQNQSSVISNHLNSGRDRSRRKSRSPLHLKRSTQVTNKIDRREKHDTPSYRRIASRDDRPSKGTQEKDSVVSSQERIRVEAMYSAHRHQQAVNRSQNLSPNLPLRHHQNSSDDTTLLSTLLKEVRELKKMVNKNERRFVESDRRSTRLEVTVNKSFIVLGDLSNAINARMVLCNPLQRETRPPNGFRDPKLPTKRLRDLVAINKDFQNDNFFNFMVNREKEFCTHSSATDTVTMTAYLKRFISVDLRASLVLKDLKGEQGLTLYHDFHKVYEFLREVMKSGYQIKSKILTNKDVHVVLRTVWGRSKQALAGEANRKR